VNTYRIKVRPLGYDGASRWGPASLSAETVADARPGAVVRSLAADTTGGLDIDLQLQRPSHEQARDDIAVALQQIGWNVVGAVVTEWVNATAQGSVLGGLGFGSAGSAGHDPGIMLVAAVASAVVGGVAGSFVQKVKVAYQVQRASPSRWMLTPTQCRGLAGPIVQPGYRRDAYAASSRTAGSKARRIVAAVRWMRSQDALMPAMARSPPPAQVAT